MKLDFSFARNATFICFITFLFASPASAVPTSEKYEVLKQAEKFATSVACATTFEADGEYATTLDDVYLVETADYDGFDFGTKYLVHWGGDWGCAGGSGTSMFYLTSFSRFSDTRPFLMEEEDILFDFDINNRFIEDVQLNDDTLTIIASDFSGDPNDLESNHSPANRYRYLLIYDTDDYAWKLVDKKFIGKNDF